MDGCDNLRAISDKGELHIPSISDTFATPWTWEEAHIFLAQGAEGGNTERVACGNIVVSSRRSEAFGTEESFILNITCNNGALLGRGA